MSERKPETSCEALAELLSAYVDGRLSDAQAKAVESHLASCPACVQRLEDYNLFRELMDADRRKNPIDLNSAVMANLEREQLLDGLELMAKPPVSRGVKLMRVVSVAAMLALMVGTVFLVMHFNGNGTRAPKLASRQQVQPATPQTPAPMIRDSQPGTSAKTRGASVPAVAPLIVDLSGQEDELPGTPPVPATEVALDSALAGGRWTKEPSLQNSREEPKSSTASLGGRGSKHRAIPAWELQDESIQPNYPLTLQPSTRPAAASLGWHRPESGCDLAWPIPLTYRLFTPDVPTRMLLKEQILIIMKESRIPVLYEQFRVRQALEGGREFYYVARKGLDLPPGSTSSQILLVTTPEKFVRINVLLQFAISEGVGQSMPAELDAFVHTRNVTPALADRVRRSNELLTGAFGLADVFGPLSTLPATTRMTIRAMHPATLVTSSPFTPTTRPATTRTAPATQPAIELTMLPVLIAIDRNAASPASRPATAPASQPTTRTSLPAGAVKPATGRP